MAITTAHHRDLLPNSIDMSTLTHSELHSLSLLSNSPLLPSPDTIATIKNSVFFNNSESSHRQTYSTTPHHHHHHHHRHHRHVTSSTFSDEYLPESVSIVKYLKHYLEKRASEKVTVELVNRNGEVVDLTALEDGYDGDRGPYDEELRRRVVGKDMEREEQVLEVLAKMDGKWCSNRKKRRIVDACLLGDALPIGWKVVVALRRKGGRFTPFCRRYISPTGEHFSSCKEVSSYLKSYFGINDTKLLRDNRGELEQLQWVNPNDDTSMLEVSYPSTSNTCFRTEHEKDVSVSGIDNLPDVRVSGLYECHSCNISFDVKDTYLQHMLSTHERTTKKFRVGSSGGDQVTVRNGNYKCEACNVVFDDKSKYSEHLLTTHNRKKKKRRLRPSVADGVIIKDGKYGCQFCDKAFEEWRRYLGHLGNHVKGSIKNTKGTVPRVYGTDTTSSVDCLATKVDNSKMDALVEIAQSSIQDVYPAVFQKGPACVNNIDQLYLAMNGSIRTSDFVPEKYIGNAELGIANSGSVRENSSPLSKSCTKVSRVSNVFPRKTGKDDGKDKTPLKNSRSPSKKTSKILIKDKTASKQSLAPCLDECLLEKDIAIAKAKAKSSTSTKVLYSSDKMRDNTMTGTTIDLDAKEDGREKTSSELKARAQVSLTFTPAGEMAEKTLTRDEVDLESNSCIDAMPMPVVESGIQADNSICNWAVKSTTIDDVGSAEEYEGGFQISFLSHNHKPSGMDFAGERIPSNMDKHVSEHAQMLDNSDLGTVAGDASAFGSNVSRTLLSSSSPFDDIFEKAGQNICNLDLNLETGNGFEYMKLDEIEPQMYKYNAMNEEDSIFLPEVSMGLEKDTEFDLRFNASANPESQFPETLTSGTMTTTMTCVWCGLEFYNEMVEIEPQPDSVGFMCPACRAKISKQFNELESNFSVASHY